MTGRIDARLAELGITLPDGIPPIGSYVPYVVTGDLVVIAGQGPARDGKYAIFGQVGTETSIEEAIEAARLCFINMLSHLKSACGGNLDRVQQVVRLGGFIFSGADFNQHAQIMNGASDLALAVFGNAGRHARTTVGASGLPMGISVEIEGLFRIA